MEISTVNQLIAAGAGLIGAFIGAGISGWINHRISNDNHKRELKSYQAGFVAEVQALQSIIAERGYLKSFQDFAQHPDILAGGKVTYEILIPDNYARFYNANLNKVGLIGPELSSKLIQYHQLLQAIVQDLQPDAAPMKYGFDKDVLDETIRIFSKALRIGDEILKENKYK
ncbi:hypothetical protein [Enterobacter sp. Crenshaw]|uniref:hypothetical protein n=1 Tax=Enterobacter sp. Crenshaw TaxID=1977566 RepID=UPI000C763B00|nr:hypothetical protein [Enterobacter sp. Crenshaw]AUM03249.1 hypothetical protein B7P19_08650 [Enterobacter sp. Crenshaw]UVH64911.1 hypothetical protein NWV12_08530 [Enterobacter sp. Crenshaw]